MKRSIGLLTAVFFSGILPIAGFAQTSSGVPPMLETQRPLAMPANAQPEPRAPQPEAAKPICRAAPVAKAKKPKTCAGGTAAATGQKKATKTAKKKATTVKPKSKVATSAS